MQQVLIAIRNTPIVFKVVDHKTDPTLAVIKARHPEIGGMVAKIAGAEAEDTVKGGHYFITVVARSDFFAGLGTFLTEVAAGNVQILPPAALQDVAPSTVPFVADLNAAEAMANEDEDAEDADTGDIEPEPEDED